MKGTNVVESALSSTQHLVNWFVSDLSDADLLVRPTPDANHIAWQLGHVIATETRLARQIPGASYPSLPAGFEEQHGKETAKQEPPKGFLTKAQYIDLFNKVREATKTSAAKLSDADLDRPTEGPMAKMAPTLAALLLLVSNHSLMHAGQFSVVRRKLGKPVLF